MTVSWQARVATFIVRRRVRPALANMADIPSVRRAFNTPLPAPRGVRYTPATVGGVAGEWVEAERPAAGDASVTTLLYLHGGGFVACSARTHRPLTAALALQGLRVFAPDYRLAPEHPFPAAPDDALAVWRALRAQLTAGHRLTVAGDSAGGNLTLALMLDLRAAGEPLPDAAAMFSPALDLTGGSPSAVSNAQRDAMFDPTQLQHLLAPYMAGADPADPRASPLLADLHGLPPTLVHVGEDEVLRDDGLRFVAKARAAGVLVQSRVFDGVSHVWQLLHRLPEARQSVRATAAFLQGRGGVSQVADASGILRAVEHHDVLVIGAGLSGIGAGVFLKQRCPGKSVVLLEGRQAIGGTWDLFRYPGVRSDSDMYTLGYVFKPWADAKAIADGPSIRRYVRETAEEHHVDRQIRFGHKVLAADWSSTQARWTVRAERPRSDGQPGTEPVTFTAGFLHNCGGYYRYDQGYRPLFDGEDSYAGTLVHPQFWPEGLDYAGKRVVVIGSGATAVTLVPEMARTAANVTMLQRSPTYYFNRPSVDPVAEKLKRSLPAMLAYRLVRLKNVGLGMYFYRLARRYPDKAKARLVGLVQQQLKPGSDVARDFTPRYNPWDQRICLVPDGDLFEALNSGRASIVTAEIDRFTPQGLRLKDGRELPADVVVTATGLQLNVLADMALSVDGRPVDLGRTLVYKGMMYGGVPNLASTFGYTNASWTLKADLTAGYVCRLLNHMDRHGWTTATPQVQPGVAPQPFLDFTSGYVQRSLAQLPKQGDRKPWKLYQNYLLDLLTLRFGRVEDGVMGFGRATRG